MKHIILLIICLGSLHSFGQITETEKVENFIKIWGLLKYKHPLVSKGKYDYNSEFINEITRLEAISTTEQFNEEMYKWVAKFDEGAKYKFKQKFPSSGTVVTDKHAFEWIDTSGFPSHLKELLHKIEANTSYGDHYAKLHIIGLPILKDHDKLEEFDPAKKEHRLLLLSSFWNAMNYWNVNITSTDMPWKLVLKNYLPLFLNAQDKAAYELAKEKLIASLDDSHSNYDSGYTKNNLLQKYPLFGGRIVNDSLVITFLRVSPSIKSQDLDNGDVIFAAEGKPLKDYYLHKFKDVISVSNEGYLRSSIEKYYLFADTLDSLQVSVLKKDGSTKKQYIKLYLREDLPKQYLMADTLIKNSFYAVKEGIGYINLDLLKHGELKKAFEEFKDYKGIVLDLRNYPFLTEEIADYLYPEEKQFVKLLLPHAPGYAVYNAKAKLRLFGNPFKAGRKNKNYFKGKIVLLVDRNTASQSEWIGMKIQQAPHCITIGEQTFGAVMNRNKVVLADSTTVDYTYSAALYPDDTPVQRKGLKIDILVKERARSFNPDLYIDEAIKLLEINYR